LPCRVRDVTLSVLSQQDLKVVPSCVNNAIGQRQGGVYEANHTCESRFKTSLHTAWWGNHLRGFKHN
jgi:hypothetical protein